MIKKKNLRRNTSNSKKTKKVFEKINTQIELKRIKAYLSVKAIDYLLPVTDLVQKKLTQLQQKLNKT